MSWVPAAKIRTPDMYTSSLLEEISVTWSEAKGDAKMAPTGLCSLWRVFQQASRYVLNQLKLKVQGKQISLFHRKNGGMF